MGGYYDEDGNWIPDDSDPGDTGGVGTVTDPGAGGADDGFSGDPTWFDNGDGTWRDPDGLLYNDAGEWIGVDFGDGTRMNIDGEIFDSNGNSIGYAEPSGGGFWDGVKNFFSSLFGGTGTHSGSSGGGGFGGSSGQQQAQQRAQQLQQQLAQARAAGATQAQIAAIQRQLAVAQAAGYGGGGMDTKTILIAAGVGLGVYALMSSRRNS